MNSTKNLWRTKEFAQLARVTVRTLHYYDRINLLKPKHFDRNGFRLYTEAEFARLQQITTLKFIGFSLKQIKEVLKGREFDLTETLKLQRKILESQKRRLELALDAITRAEKVFDENSGAIDRDSFKNIIEVINMQQDMDLTRRYYSESAQAKIAERQKTWTPELQEEASRRWKELFTEIKAAIAEGVTPADARAKKLAERWEALIEEFTGGDAEIREGLKKMYADEKNWQTEWNQPFNDEVRNFIDQASKYSG